MSVDLIAAKLARMQLMDVDGEGVSVAMVGPMLYVSDGSSGFYTDPKAAWRGIKAMDKCSPDEFWDRAWLDAPSYDSLAEVWDSLDTPQFDAADRPPRSPEFLPVGRLRKFGPREYLLQTDTGDYGVVDEKQVAKWRLTPLD
ncbi:MAG: hypothetical protein ACP59X_09870 [Solidesulfovibrio sp. DCME]|uniref:hypothetical protein n=1 Tax=Solidesulfovibrio sp. DCME TaxID=3447380 RepID=UPI003D0E3CF4